MRVSRGAARARRRRRASRCGSFTLALLVASYGPGSTLARMGWFFTKAALLTFGGAYAVLPYVYQGAVETYAWLTPAQMIDGLALGETTPGPLIMVVAFVGFVGGWTKALFGPDSLRAGRHRRRVRRDVLHVPAVVPVHPRRRAAGRVDAWAAALHGAADRHHRRRRRRRSSSLAALLRVARVLAGRLERRVAAAGTRPGGARDRRRGHGRAVPLQGRRDPGDPRAAASRDSRRRCCADATRAAEIRRA